MPHVILVMDNEGKISVATVAEYLAYEAGTVGRVEYYKGEIVPKESGSEEHCLIATNFMSLLGGNLKGGPCRCYDGNLKVAIKHADSIVFPDCMVICGPSEKLENRSDVVTNPTLIVEVLSPSTALHDRTFKFMRYRMLPSLKEYVLIEQDQYLVDVYFLNADGHWMYASYEGLDAVVELRSLGVKIGMGEIYGGVGLV